MSLIHRHIEARSVPISTALEALSALITLWWCLSRENLLVWIVGCALLPALHHSALTLHEWIKWLFRSIHYHVLPLLLNDVILWNLCRSLIKHWDRARVSIAIRQDSLRLNHVSLLLLLVSRILSQSLMCLSESLWCILFSLISILELNHSLLLTWAIRWRQDQR